VLIESVRLGIRAQLLLSIAALLVLALVPLFFAVASLTRASMKQNWERNARALGRTVAGHVAEARRARVPASLDPFLEAQLGDGVAAVVLYDRDGSRVHEVVSAAPLREVLQRSATVDPGRAQVIDVLPPAGPAILVIVPSTEGPVGVLVRTTSEQWQVGPLVRLVAFYMALLGSALLVFLYFVLTRLVVAPIDLLSRAASKVAAGERELRVPRRGGTELIELGSSLALMTETLRSEEDELRRNVTEIEQAALDLKNAQATLVRSERLASVGRLAAGLAHEIGNPITAILSFQELLLEGELDDEPRDFVERMKRETERVHRVLRDLLDFARPVKTERVEERGTASISDAVEQVVQLVRPQRALKQVELMITVERGLPLVALRPERLEQVLLNLLLNAADAIGGGAGRITVSALAGADSVELAIEDTGGGIDDGVRDQVFEPFVTTKDVGKGTGLGLAVCRGLVESVGGTIHVDDGADGARFVLTLPHASSAS